MWLRLVESREKDVKILGSREFNQDVSLAKRAARIEPVFITDRGRPTHVLMSIDSFRRLAGDHATIVDMLASPDAVANVSSDIRKGSVWDGEG